MPQKPAVRAKDKRRLTKRLEKWRAKREQQATPPAAASKGAAPKPAS